MSTDLNLDKLLKEAIGEHLIKDPGQDFSAQMVKVLAGKPLTAEPLISGKTIVLMLALLVGATLILALGPSSTTMLPSTYIPKINIPTLFNNIDFHFSLESNVVLIVVCTCFLILFQLMVLKKLILR
ncbi:MAG: hypothetical protein RLZZ420_2369 [Bacteroidota bacterium]|jgi:hypothetical protein